MVRATQYPHLAIMLERMRLLVPSSVSMPRTFEKRRKQISNSMCAYGAYAALTRVRERWMVSRCVWRFSIMPTATSCVSTAVR